MLPNSLRKSLVAFVVSLSILLGSTAQAAITFTLSNKTGPYAVGGNSSMVTGKMNLSGTYVTGGFTLNPRTFGFTVIQQVILQGEDGYDFFYDQANAKIMAFQGASGTNGTSAVTGTGTYTDGATSGALNLASPAFSGTGLTAAGQVITTTDNQTMTLNQCAGMWLISATGATPPNLILSNTAVTGAPAVLTVQGAASTDAGAYKIVKNLTVGSVTALSGTAAAQTFTGGGAATQVPNATDLGSVDQVNYVIIGR